MRHTLTLVALTGLTWCLVFFIAAFLTKQGSKLSYRLGMTSFIGMGLWVFGWIGYLGWWVSQHLCY